MPPHTMTLSLLTESVMLSDVNLSKVAFSNGDCRHEPDRHRIGDKTWAHRSVVNADCTEYVAIVNKA